MLHTAALCLLGFVAAPATDPVAPAGPDTVVVCPREFLTALGPWIAHRESQGHRVEIIPNSRSAAELRQAIRDLASQKSLRYILLVGDADPRAERDPALRARTTPTYQVPAKVNVKWGSEPEIGTDNWYADLNDDGVPELAVGRLPVDSREELAIVVGKILDYENNSDFGEWRRRVQFVAGVGGFGALADSVLESATKKFLTDGIPAAFQTTMTYGSWRSAYCPDPRLFRETTRQRFNEGCLFWVYIGHGQRTELDRVYVPGSTYPILQRADIASLDHGGRPPIAVFLSCYAGAFDGVEDCLAEELVVAPRGAVAALAGSRVTMPYAMAVLSTELLQEVFSAGGPATLGEVLLRAKQRSMHSEPVSQTGKDNRLLLDALAKAISPAPELLTDERREHLDLFNLLGDPLLRLPQPQPVLLEVPGNLRAGEVCRVTVKCDLAGTCRLDLVCRRDRMRIQPPTREYYDGRDRILREYQSCYEAANDPAWCVHTLKCQPGNTEFEFTVPEEARGQCHLRAFVQGSTGAAIGSQDVFVRRPVQTAQKNSSADSSQNR